MSKSKKPARDEFRVCSKCGKDCADGYADEGNRLCENCAPPVIKPGDTMEFLCGLPVSSLAPWERAFLEREKEKYKQYLVNDQAVTLVNEVISCELKLRRNGIEQEECGIGARDTKARTALEEERDKICKRQLSYLDGLSALPKQDRGASSAEQAWSELARKYRKERKVRLERTGGVLGGFSADAQKLAKRVGRDIADFDVPIERVTDPDKAEELFEEIDDG